jgi:hypothetical protein
VRWRSCDAPPAAATSATGRQGCGQQIFGFSKVRGNPVLFSSAQAPPLSLSLSLVSRHLRRLVVAPCVVHACHPPTRSPPPRTSPVLSPQRFGYIVWPPIYMLMLKANAHLNKVLLPKHSPADRARPRLLPGSPEGQRVALRHQALQQSGRSRPHSTASAISTMVTFVILQASASSTAAKRRSPGRTAPSAKRTRAAGGVRGRCS